MKMNATINKIAIVLGTIFVTLFLLATASQAKARGHRRGGIGQVPCNDGVIVITPNSLWPPNHKLVTVDVAYIDNDHDGDALTVAIDSVLSNQDAPDGTSECGPSKGPDWIIGPAASGTDPGSAATSLELRSERCANEGSRIYTITVTCTEGEPSGVVPRSETVDLMVTVAHDQGN